MRKFFTDYGTLFILVALCILLSWATMTDQTQEGAEAGRQVAETIAKESPKPAGVMLAVRANQTDDRFVEAATAVLRENGIPVVGVARGVPAEVRDVARKGEEEGQRIDVILCTAATRTWPVFNDIGNKIPSLAGASFGQPETHRWPTFLKKDNLINVANQSVVITIIAIGMTMVIITGGIELSVGSLIALASCLVAWFIREWGGGESAGTATMILFSVLAILICGLMGLFTGFMVTVFGIPPFIVTLANMMVASGLAYIISQGNSIYQIPWSFTTLGRATLFWDLPVSVCICLVLYIIAYILMSHTSLGRYIYAVGGNQEAARLSGVPVRFIIFFVYVATAVLAGFGGIITASQLKAGAPICGVGYEMFVIAATVVGGTSLAGGEGKIFGTLIGSFIIAAIQNGMNLMGVESYTQKVVLGLVILAAVLLDRLKQSNAVWDFFRRRTVA